MGRGEWGEAPVGGEEDVQTVVSVTDKLQGCMVQPMEYSRYFIVTINGGSLLKLVNHHVVQMTVVQHSTSTIPQFCCCDPVDRSTPGLPVRHQLPELTQSHVHGVGDAIQPAHPLSSPSPPALNLSQPQGLFDESVHRIRWTK